MNREETILANQKLVWKVVQKYKERGAYLGFEPDDLFGYGCIGLIKACDAYDPTKSKFSTFAYSCINTEIHKALRDYSNKSRVYFTRNVIECATEIRRKALEHKTAHEIAKEVNRSIRIIGEALSYIHHRLHSTETVVANDDESITLGDQIGGNDDYTHIEVNDFISSLSKKEKTVCELLIRGQKQNVIKQKAGCSQNHVSRLKRKIGKKYKEYAGTG